jgi:hypothetical protein
MASTQKVIRETIAVLAERYSFDAVEALAHVLNAKKEASPAYARAKKAADATRAKISELEQKIASKKVKNADKSAETLAGLRAKLIEQVERLAKFDDAVSETATVASDAETEIAIPLSESESEAPAVPEKKKKVSKKKESESEAPEKKEAPKKGDGKEKRIARMTPTISKQLKAEFDTQLKGAVEFVDDHKKKFTKYINEMEEEAFAGKSLPHHMTDFANKFKVAPVDEMPTEAPVDKNKIAKIAYEELAKASLVDNDYGAGVYWDTANKRFVRGPAAVADEDVSEVTFEGNDYVVGDVSKRVYLVGDTDVFAGFAGVGAFKKMTV